ncbi:MAG: cell wall hydrolase [Alphaproteobacteria bacterium]|nr:cell wall hydrolase [Alphaproteobacteria bacterium]
MLFENDAYDRDVFCQGECCNAVDILARTVYGEARGEGLLGMEAVASVVINRVRFARQRGGFWWGATVKDVCLRPKQFSCWNSDDANSELITKVDASDKIFALCRRIARRAVCGVLLDPTRGATHYHNRKCSPLWARKAIPCAEIGNHVFYDKV